MNPKYTILQYYFSSDEVVERQEYLVYDDNAVIGYIGGTLGLFLGLSCFGLLKSSFNKILEYLIKDKEKNTESVSTIKMSERQQNYLTNHQAALHFKNDCNYFSLGNLAFQFILTDTLKKYSHTTKIRVIYSGIIPAQLV